MPNFEAFATPNAVPSHTLSAAGTTFSPQFEVQSNVDWIALQVNVTAISGTTPSLALAVQWSNDGGTTWADADTADTFTAVTATGNVVKRFPTKGLTVRLKEVFTGTLPSATYNAHLLQR